MLPHSGSLLPSTLGPLNLPMEVSSRESKPHLNPGGFSTAQGYYWVGDRGSETREIRATAPSKHIQDLSSSCIFNLILCSTEESNQLVPLSFGCHWKQSSTRPFIKGLRNTGEAWPRAAASLSSAQLPANAAKCKATIGGGQGGVKCKVTIWGGGL